MTDARGITGYGVHLPFHRLDRADIGRALGRPVGHGSRTVASFDEDAVTMATTAGLHALSTVPGIAVDRLLFATTSPPLADRTNATDIHAALGLDERAAAFDLVGSVRSGVAAVRAALDAAGTVVVTTGDVRTGRPQSGDEAGGGDAAAALVIGGGDGVVAELLADTSVTVPVRYRWRQPGESTASTWEERFGEHALVEPTVRAVAAALKEAQLEIGAVDHLIVTGTHARAARRVASVLGADGGALVDDLSGSVGNAGTAHPWLLLGDVLDRAEPGAIVALVTITEGADVQVWRATPALADRRATPTVAEQLARGRPLDYLTYLSWRGFLDRQPPRRPDPVPPDPPPSLRHADWKFGFVAGRCSSCGERNVPPQQVCFACGAVGAMTDERLVGERGTITTFSIDRLAYSLHPPVVTAVLDLDGGGRTDLEITDAVPEDIAVGDRVSFAFRIKHQADGVPNYFWKAIPEPEAD